MTYQKLGLLIPALTYDKNVPVRPRDLCACVHLWLCVCAPACVFLRWFVHMDMRVCLRVPLTAYERGRMPVGACAARIHVDGECVGLCARATRECVCERV